MSAQNDGDRDGDAGFLSRWSRRKATQARGERVPDEPSAPLPSAPTDVAVAKNDATVLEPVTPETPAAPQPTLDDVAALTRDADFSRFVAPGVDDGVKRAALRKLFSDPHYNVMDGLDTYIDDYNKADPLPASMLRKMTQSAFLGLFREDDENPDLQLQPDDADRRPGPEPGDVDERGGDANRDAS
jgi:Protein of unknown function (DUF3306)